METTNTTTGTETASATTPVSSTQETTPASAAQAAPTVDDKQTTSPAAVAENKPSDKKVELAKTPEVFADVKQLKIPDGISEAEKEFLNGWLGKASKTAVDGKQPVTAVQVELETKLNTFRDVAAFGDAQIKAQQTAWDNAVKSDPKLGGDNLNRTSQLVERSLKTLFGDTFYESDLKANFFLHHPEVIKGLVKFAEQAGDPSLTLGNKPAAGKWEPKNIGERVYGANYNPMKISPQ
jgi:hypothetical protein